MPTAGADAAARPMPSDLPTGRDLATEAAGAAQRGVDALLRSQHPNGWWKGELQTNVTMDAEDLLARQFLGILDPETSRRTANWIRSQQRVDGTWATFFEGPADLSTTVEAYVALRLAGDSAHAEHLVKAASFILDAGGIAATRVFTRLWLALFGVWSWSELPALPPEVMLLPPWMPLNIYDFACWARQTIVPLTVVASHRPVRPLGVNLDELGGPPAASDIDEGGTSLRRALSERPMGLALLDVVLRAYDRRPWRWLRRRAIAKAERWIVRRQEADGGWGGIQPPWVYSLLALHLQGYPLDHPVMRAGLAGLDGFTIDDGEQRRLEACQSPVWDTALAVIALRDAGLASDHPSVVKAGDWLLGEEIRVKGDWAVRRPHLQPGGWAFEFANDNYADIDDTAEVVLALLRVWPADDPRAAEAIRRGTDWVVGMQCRDGGWGAFDVDNDRAVCRRLPFCDFGEVIDPPSADVTAHVIEMLAALGSATGPPGTPSRVVMDRGVAWLVGEQEGDGSWFGRWGVNHVYGTGAAVPALIAAGIGSHAPVIRRALTWLEAHQRLDGGWGEDIRSYGDPDWRGRGASTASQTAWAVLALLAAGEVGPVVDAGIAFLVDTQRADGSWDEPWYTGTGFPSDFSINYHLYRQVFPLMALGRYVTAAR